MNKLITALKENKNDARKKAIVAASITVAAVAAGVVLAKMKDNSEQVVLVLEEAGSTLAEATSE